MKKDETLLEARNRYILEKINSSDSIVKVVHEISSELFISERTIYRVIKSTDTMVERVDKRENRL